MEIIKKPDPQFAFWHGIPREEIPWYPTIDEDKCIGCKLCYVTCGRNVFSFDSERNKAVVYKPYNCMVGCSTCATVCPTGAILFPSREIVQKIEKEYRVIGKIQKRAKAKMAKQEYEKVRAEVLAELQKATFKMKYEVAGHILESGLLNKILEYIQDKPLDLVDIKLSTPSIKGCWNEKAPSYAEFVLTSTGESDIEGYLNDIDKIIEDSGCVIVEKSKI